MPDTPPINSKQDRSLCSWGVSGAIFAFIAYCGALYWWLRERIGDSNECDD